MGAPNAVNGALMMCTFGMAPSALTVLPMGRTMVEGQPAANIMDAVPMLNIKPFGMCMSLANPTVAAATAAALGVLTPMPCIPNTQAWVPGSPISMVAGKPALTTTSQCICAYGGVITLSFAGSTRTVTT